MKAAFYSLRPGGWRDYVTLIHWPYTLWNLSYVCIGAALAPEWLPGRLGAGLVAFFLGLGIAAHALDELKGRPLGTEIPAPRALGARRPSRSRARSGSASRPRSPGRRGSSPSSPFGAFMVCAYNLELFGGRFHGDWWLAVAWGATPILSAYLVAAEKLTWQAGFAAALRRAADRRAAAALDACPRGTAAHAGRRGRRPRGARSRRRGRAAGDDGRGRRARDRPRDPPRLLSRMARMRRKQQSADETLDAGARATRRADRAGVPGSHGRAAALARDRPLGARRRPHRGGTPAGRGAPRGIRGEGAPRGDGVLDPPPQGAAEGRGAARRVGPGPRAGRELDGRGDRQARGAAARGARRGRPGRCGRRSRRSRSSRASTRRPCCASATRRSARRRRRSSPRPRTWRRRLRSAATRCRRSPTGSPCASASCSSASTARRPRRRRGSTSGSLDVERRQVERLQRSLEHESARLLEDASREFHKTVRAAQEDAARRLARELERALASISSEGERMLRAEAERLRN